MFYNTESISDSSLAFFGNTKNSTEGVYFLPDFISIDSLAVRVNTTNSMRRNSSPCLTGRPGGRAGVGPSGCLAGQSGGGRPGSRAIGRLKVATVGADVDGR